MKIPARMLNRILINLPHPSLAHDGRIRPFVEVPVYEPNYEIREALLPNHHALKIRKLRFEYDVREMDWVLMDLDV